MNDSIPNNFVREQRFSPEIGKSLMEVASKGGMDYGYLDVQFHHKSVIWTFIRVPGTPYFFTLLILGEFHNPIGEADKYCVPRFTDLVRISMEELLKLDADILCEGHFGIYRTKEAVREYIMGYIRMYAG